MNLKLNWLDWSFLFRENLLAIDSWNTTFLNILYCFLSFFYFWVSLVLLLVNSESWVLFSNSLSKLKSTLSYGLQEMTPKLSSSTQHASARSSVVSYSSTGQCCFCYVCKPGGDKVVSGLLCCHKLRAYCAAALWSLEGTWQKKLQH